MLVLDPAIVRRVFLTDFHTFAHNDFGDVVDKSVDPILGYNPSFLNGDEWKERRSDITPAFTLSRVWDTINPHEYIFNSLPLSDPSIVSPH